MAEQIVDQHPSMHRRRALVPIYRSSLLVLVLTWSTLWSCPGRGRQEQEQERQEQERQEQERQEQERRVEAQGEPVCARTRVRACACTCVQIGR